MRPASQVRVAAVVFILVCSTLGLELYGPARARAVLFSMMTLLSRPWTAWLICPQKLATGLQGLPTAESGVLRGPSSC